MSKESSNWPDISNSFAGIASICTVLVFLPPYPRSTIVGIAFTAVMLLASYISALRIKDCEIPFIRVTIIWSMFSTIWVGIFIPFTLLVKSENIRIAGIYFGIGIIFALVFIGMFFWAKYIEKNNT